MKTSSDKGTGGKTEKGNWKNDTLKRGAKKENKKPNCEDCSCVQSYPHAKHDESRLRRL